MHTPALPQTRRSFMNQLALGSAVALHSRAVLGTAVAAPETRPPAPPASSNVIHRENTQPGTTDWLLRRTDITPPHPLWHMFGLRSPKIEGYCSHPSIRSGEELTVYVSTAPSAAFTLEVYRMGYYGGTGGRLMARFGPERGRTQPTPEAGPKRVIHCQWEPSLKFTIPSEWVSGVYVGKLTEQNEGNESYLIFIVRDDRRADFLFQCSDMTWQAYNRWPYNHSLYCNGEIDHFTDLGVGVGIDRPYGKYTQLADQTLSLGSGEWFLTEFPLAFWLEQQGYDVSYISNWDTHGDPAGLRRAAGWMSVGHDEYWTGEMFRHVQEAIRDGLNVAFLSANSVATRIEITPGSDGRTGLAFERAGDFEPRENTLIGGQSPNPVVGGGDWVCRAPEHWLFTGTGMKHAEGIPGLVGWEFHGEPADIPGLQVVASDITDGRRHPREAKAGDPLHASQFASTIYSGPKGNIVFNAGTCWWSDGLSEPPGYQRSDWYTPRFGPDARVQRITANLLDRMRQRF